MKKIIASLLLSLLCSSCVKIEPGNVVSDTIDAGKDAYETIKRNRNGEEERIYSHTIRYNSRESNAINIANCTREIVEIIEASDLQLSKVISESSEIKEAENGTLVACSLTALVRQ